MMSFISYFINGLSLGSVYAIIALGYTMVYGIAKMLNFAHGDVIQSEVLYISCYDSGFEACRRETDDFRGNAGYHRFLYRDYGGTDYLHQENEGRAGHAGCIRR